jgi:hypothetical protein
MGDDVDGLVTCGRGGIEGGEFKGQIFSAT